MIWLKKYSYGIVSAVSLFLLPLTLHAKTLQQLVDDQIIPIGNTIVKLLYALAFLAFLVGMMRFFFSDNAESREKGKYFAIYSIIGLVALFGVWGIVHVLLDVLNGFNA